MDLRIWIPSLFIPWKLSSLGGPLQQPLKVNSLAGAISEGLIAVSVNEFVEARYFSSRLVLLSLQRPRVLRNASTLLRTACSHKLTPVVENSLKGEGSDSDVRVADEWVVLTFVSTLMSQQRNASQIYTYFLTLLKELEDFVETHDLKLAFDREEKVYIVGNDFTEQIQSDFALHVEVIAQMRKIIARNCKRIHPSP